MSPSWLSPREKDRRVRLHPLFMYSHTKWNLTTYVFAGPSGPASVPTPERAFRWILDHDAKVGTLDYEKNKIMDHEFGTDVNSPLHRSNRFPTEWAAEQASRRHAG